MKHRVLALLLALLLLAAEPASALAAVREPDFKALKEAGEAPCGEILMVMEPTGTTPLMSLLVSGKYCVFRNPDSLNVGVADVFGNLYWELPNSAPSSGRGIIKLYPNGCCLVGSSSSFTGCLYNLKGQKVSDKAMEMYWSTVTDRVTGKEWIASGWTTEGHGDSLYGTYYGFDGSKLHLGSDMGEAVYNGMITYRDDASGKYGVSKTDGTVVVKPTYEFLYFLNKDTLICCKNEKYGAIRPDGTVVFSCQYTDFTIQGLWEKERIIVEKNGKWGVIDYVGREVVPCVYDSISRSSSSYHDDLINYDFNPAAYPYRGFRTEGGVRKEYKYAESSAAAYCGSREVPFGTVNVGTNLWCVWEEGKGCKLTDSQGKTLLSAYFAGIDAGKGYVLLKNVDGSGKSRLYNSKLKLVWEKSGADCAFANDTVVFRKQSSGQTNLEFYGLDGKLVRTVKNAQIGDGGSEYLVCTPYCCTVYQNGKYALINHDGTVMTDFLYAQITGNAEAGSNLLLLDLADVSDENGATAQLLFDTGIWKPALDADVTFYFASDLICTRRGCYCVCGRDGKYGVFYWRSAADGPYLDTPASAWYAEAVKYCTNAGLMNGTGKGSFMPKKEMTRAMLVQVLYNLSGEKTASQGFRDVPKGKWFSDAVNWAAANGIVNGKTKDLFGPNDPVTREQMVVILHRYAQRFGPAEGDPSVLAAYTDAGQISAYAKDAMAWAVKNGILTGKTATTLVPKGHASRAEIATVLQRFVNLMAAKQ